MVNSDAQRKSNAEERERLQTETDRAKKEAQDKAEQVEFEKSVTAKSTERFNKAAQERDALQRELAALKAELGKDKGSERRIAELIAEKDALAQQQAALSKQVAEFQKAGETGRDSRGRYCRGGSGRRRSSSKESSRQIEELQRRILGFESSSARDRAGTRP